MYSINAKRMRKDSRIQRLQQQVALITHIATEYEKTLIQIGRYAGRFAHGPNPAKDVLVRINRQIRGAR